MWPALKSRDAAVQVVCVGAFDLRGDNLADLQRAAAREIDAAVDLGCVGLRPAPGNGRSDLIDDDLLPRADLALEAARRNLLLARHQRVVALLLDPVGDCAWQRIRRCTRDRLVFEA